MRAPRRLLPCLLAAALAAPACGPDEGGGSAGAGDRPNVLLVSLDSTRRDLLGTYGRRPRHAPERSPSPRLDALAAEGVRMEDAYATTSWTLPSHLSMLSGRPELAHAVDLDYHRPARSVPLLAELLGRAGYRTAGFFTGPYLEPHFGFDRGFERYEAGYGPALAGATRRARELRGRISEAEAAGDARLVGELRAALGAAEREVEVLSHRDVSSRAVTDLALAELAAAAEDPRPFFLFVHYFDPHYDYTPPAPYDEAFDPDYEGDLDGEGFYTSERIRTFEGGRPVRAVSERDLEHVLALYEGELAWTDAEIGRLLDRLAELGLERDTLVVVTADHGDEFFEHGDVGHRSTLYEELVAVPLLLRLPGRLPAGASVEGIVSTTDLVPTVLELVDLSAPADLPSASFVGLIEGDDDGEGRSALGRIVRTRYGGMIADGRQVPIQLVTVLESFHRGDVKLLREVSWPEPGPGATTADEALVAAKRAVERRRERLRWIDLAAHPGEPEEAWRTDFADPRARAALEAFRERYRELLALRREAGTAERDATLEAALGALGYADSGGPRASEAFVLPPPGERVPGVGDG